MSSYIQIQIKIYYPLNPKKKFIKILKTKIKKNFKIITKNQTITFYNNNI